MQTFLCIKYETLTDIRMFNHASWEGNKLTNYVIYTWHKNLTVSVISQIEIFLDVIANYANSLEKQMISWFWQWRDSKYKYVHNSFLEYNINNKYNRKRNFYISKKREHIINNNINYNITESNYVHHFIILCITWYYNYLYL